MLSYHETNKQTKQMEYLCSKRSDKPRIAWQIFEMIQSRGGRFVRRNKLYKSTTTNQGISKHTEADDSKNLVDDTDGVAVPPPPSSSSSSFAWEELSDRQSFEKICQSLREGAPEMRRRMIQFREQRIQNQNHGRRVDDTPRRYSNSLTSANQQGCGWGDGNGVEDGENNTPRLKKSSSVGDRRESDIDSGRGGGGAKASV
jgi:hypothetical protein